MKKILRLSLFLSFLLAFASQAYAQPAGKISIQGVLKGATGASVPDGSYLVTFRLYDAVTGGSLKWTENATLDVVAGVYSHYLGSTTPLDMLDFGSTFFLEVQVGASVMTPRTELPYAPYSLSVVSTDIADAVICSGAVGDVKYSILEPTEFAEENGDCWVPMKGQMLAVNDTLRKKWQVKKLPDASGMFLRGHVLAGHEFVFAIVDLIPIPLLFHRDPDRTSATPAAQVQMDEIRKHSHSITDPGHLHTFSDDEYVDNSADGSVENKYLSPFSNLFPSLIFPNDYIRKTASAKTGITVQNTGGAENRPKNLSLYTYIRVN